MGRGEGPACLSQARDRGDSSHLPPRKPARVARAKAAAGAPPSVRSARCARRRLPGAAEERGTRGWGERSQGQRDLPGLRPGASSALESVTSNERGGNIQARARRPLGSSLGAAELAPAVQGPGERSARAAAGRVSEDGPGLAPPRALELPWPQQTPGETQTHRLGGTRRAQGWGTDAHPAKDRAATASPSYLSHHSKEPGISTPQGSAGLCQL